MKYFDEAREIWKQFVPKAGQSETVQGEMLRSIEKLRDEALRNGNLNWDEGFEILLTYLGNKLSDPAVFSYDEILRSEFILSRLMDFNNPYLEDNLYDELSDSVVEYFRHYGSQPHKTNPELYR